MRRNFYADRKHNLFSNSHQNRACARAGKYKDAIELLEVLQDLGLKPDVYCYTAAIDGK